MAGNWGNVTQRQSERLTPGGTFESIVTVSFQLASGTSGSVIIPARLYNADYVREVIDAKAKEMAAVEALQG